MSNARSFRRVLNQEKTVHVLPSIPDDASPALKDAIAIRNAASTTGRCQCGAEVEIVGRDEIGVIHALFVHEDDCPAADDNLDRLLAQVPANDPPVDAQPEVSDGGANS